MEKNMKKTEDQQVAVTDRGHQAESLLDSMNGKLDAMAAEDRVHPTIFRVPAHLRRDLYVPNVVSIGPYHRGKEGLRTLEELKWRCLHHMLTERSKKATLAECIRAMREEELKARRCYADRSFDLSSDNFVEMLLLDGCFLISLLWPGGRGRGLGEEADAIFNLGWMKPTITSDLLLLENQIPFFVVLKLYDLLIGPYSIRVMTYIWDPRVPVPDEANNHFDHLLHRYYLTKLSPPPSQQLNSNAGHSNSTTFRIPSAKDLRDAGVKFKACKGSSDILGLDVKFTSCRMCPTMEIPKLTIWAEDKPWLLNLVAFEQRLPAKERRLAAYAFLMDSLVDTPNDVAILQESKIIDHYLSGTEELATFFNKLCECAAFDAKDHYLIALFNAVNKYHECTINRWRAKLMRDYFNTPWAGVGTIVGLIVLILGLVQTFFSFYDRFKNPYLKYSIL